MSKTLTLNQFNQKLKNVSNFDYTNALTKSCLLVQKSAKENLTNNDSVVTGQLRNSIMFEVSGDTGTVYTNTEYAPYVEYGTGIWAVEGDGRQDTWRYQDAEGNWHTTIGQQPKPFMEPALYNNEEKILDIFTQEIIKEFTK